MLYKDASDYAIEDDRYYRKDCAQDWDLWCDALGINELMEHDEHYEHFLLTTVDDKIAFLEKECAFGYFLDDNGVD